MIIRTIKPNVQCKQGDNYQEKVHYLGGEGV